jgi:hypothetical protein
MNTSKLLIRYRFSARENPTLALQICQKIICLKPRFAQLEELIGLLGPWGHRIKETFGYFVPRRHL